MAFNNLGFNLQNDEYTQVSTPHCKHGYDGCNPLLIDSVRSEPLLLDRPHLGGGVSMDFDSTSISSRPYKNYSTIKGGHYQYYVPINKTPLSRPIFTALAPFSVKCGVDPMTNPYVEYNRVESQMWIPSRSYSFTVDSSNHRDDLIALQRRLMNRSDYTYSINYNK